MTDDCPDSPGDDDERNTLRLAWQNLEQPPRNNAERAFRGWEILLEQKGIDLLFVSETREFYAYHDGVWKPDGEQVLREYARQMMTTDYSTSVFRELKEQVRTTNAVSVDDLGVPEGTVAVKNGLLDIRERDLRDLRPNDYALHRLPVEYDANAASPKWVEFLEQVTSDESARQQLQEFVGYALAGGEPWMKKALMIFGPTDAGKTIFLEVGERLFGDAANAAQTPQYLANQRWGVDQLAGKPVNIRHDIDATKIQHLGILKEIIDGNTVTAEQKGKSPYSFKPETRHLFAANRAPKRQTDDEAFWNRWLTVVFPESVPAEEQVPKPELLSDLTAELPGILNWALDGLDRLLENDGFTDAPSPDEVRRLWEQYGTPTERFKSTYLVKEPGAAVPKHHVQYAFTHFCVEHGHEDITDQKLGEQLKKDPQISDSQRRMNGERTHVYTGIQLSEDAPTQDVTVEVSNTPSGSD